MIFVLGVESFHLQLNEKRLSDAQKIFIKTTIEQTNALDALKDFKIIDNVSNLSVFSLILQKLINVQKLSIKSNDRNLKKIFEKYLPKMSSLKELHIESTPENMTECLIMVKETVGDLKKIRVN